MENQKVSSGQSQNIAYQIKEGEIHPLQKFQKVVDIYRDNILAHKEYIEEIQLALQKRPIKKVKNWKNRLILAKSKVELVKTQDALKMLNTRLEARENEFHTYLKTFNAELNECGKNFDTLYNKAKHICEYLKDNYFTLGVKDYLKNNPNNADLEYRVVFYRFLKNEMRTMEALATKNPEYKS